MSEPHEHHHGGHDHDGHGHDEHGHGHGHPSAAGAGPLADASVRRARVNDAPAVGLVQAVVFREAYSGRVPDEVVAQFEPDVFARSWRESLTAPPGGIHKATLLPPRLACSAVSKPDGPICAAITRPAIFLMKIVP